MWKFVKEKKTKSKDFSVFNVQDIRIQYVFKTTFFYTKIMMKINKKDNW